MKNGPSFLGPFGKVFNRFLCYPLAYLVLHFWKKVSTNFYFCNPFGYTQLPVIHTHLLIRLFELKFLSIFFDAAVAQRTEQLHSQGEGVGSNPISGTGDGSDTSVLLPLLNKNI